MSKLADIRCENGIFFPINQSEVQTIIKFARTEHATVRVMGAHHSPAAAIFGRAKKQLCVHLDGTLKKIHFIREAETKDYAIVSVGAGCYLGVNPKDKYSTLQNSFNWQVDQAGYSLTSLGGISHQSIAGFLQTSSSGGTVKHGLADMLIEIEMINGKGEICHFRSGMDEFDGVGVGMGLFGIITNVILKLPKKYLVEGVEENKLKQHSMLQKDQHGQYLALAKALFEEHEYAHINWFPQRFVNRTMQWTGRRVHTDLPIHAYRHPLQSSLLNYMAAFALKAGNILDGVSHNNFFTLGLKSILLKAFVPLNKKQWFRDDWYKALPIDDQVDVNGLMDTLFCEMWFPKDEIDNVMIKLESLFATDPKAIGNFIVEFYAAKASPFWLSPSYGRDSFRVDLYWWRRNFGNSETYFARFWDVLLEVPGARFHWGKHLPIPGKSYGRVSRDGIDGKRTTFNLEYLSKTYSKLKSWLDLREQMDPHQIFVNDYWRDIFSIPTLTINKKIINFYSDLYTPA